MTTTTTSSAFAAIATVLSTEYNSLLNNTNTVASSAVDNSTVKDLYVDLELSVGTFSSARSAGGVIVVFLVTSLDGTNYGDINELTADTIALFPLDASVTARRITRRDIPIPPGLFKLFSRNAATGQTMPASGNTLKMRTHSLLST